MIKVFASALFLAMLVAAPVDRASAASVVPVSDFEVIDCTLGWTIEAGGTKGNGLLTVRNRCLDVVTVTLIGKKGPKDIALIPPGQTRSLYFKISQNESIDVIGAGLAGDFDMVVE